LRKLKVTEGAAGIPRTELLRRGGKSVSSKSIPKLDPTLVEHRRVWEAKPTLRAIYADYHRRMLNACPRGRVLDIGGGFAYVKHYRRDVISADILPFPGIDVVCDAHALPFAQVPISRQVSRPVRAGIQRKIDRAQDRNGRLWLWAVRRSTSCHSMSISSAH
jgi:hypothetical protein